MRIGVFSSDLLGTIFIFIAALLVTIIFFILTSTEFFTISTILSA